MGTSVFGRLWSFGLLVASVAFAVLFVGPTPAAAFGGILNDWENTYPDSDSGFNANCQLCHVEANGGDPFNAYGWALVLALEPDGCGPGDLDLAFACTEEDDSDLDPTDSDNLTEIDASTQPGWTDGPFNTWYSREAPPDESNLPPTEPIGPLDPDGTGGTGGTGGGGGTAGGGGTGGGGGTAGGGGTGGGGGTAGGGGTGGTGGDECDPGHDRIPPGQFKRGTIVVKPGQSIQEAIDRAQEGTRIFVHGGVYTEPCNETNGLEITKSGIHLIGQSNENKRVIIESTNGQRNGIAIVAPEVPAAAQPLGREVEHTDCMGCHTDMAPPFPLMDDVPTGMDTSGDPWLYDITVESITIRGFRNNGIFTRHVDGFLFHDLESINNRNYGIFPVLSRNGAITNSFSTGSDLDSALWVETSEHVLVQGNVVEKSTNGIEVSNSDDILVIDNEMRDNTIGAAILLLPDIYDDRPGAKRIDLINNWIHDNNRPNGANPGSILGFFPAGEGILFAGVDDSVISGNLIENNDFIGIAIADYCGALAQTSFACPTVPSPEFPAGFLEDQAAVNNTVVGNVLVNNATNPDPGPPDHPPNPFAFAAGDLSLLTLPTFIVGLPGDPTPFHGNCYEDNATSGTPEFFALWYAFLFENPDLVQPEGPFPPPPFPPWAPPPCP